MKEIPQSCSEWEQEAHRQQRAVENMPHKTINYATL